MAFFGRKNKKEEPVQEKNVEDGHKPSVQISDVQDAGAYSSIISPLVTEKSSSLATYNQYVFKVPKKANKIDVKRSIKKLYRVNVEAVNMINLPSKKRRLGKITGTKSGYKKAIVTLRQGDKIDIV